MYLVMKITLSTSVITDCIVVWQSCFRVEASLFWRCISDLKWSSIESSSNWLNAVVTDLCWLYCFKNLLVSLYINVQQFVFKKIYNFHQQIKKDRKAIFVLLLSQLVQLELVTAFKTDIYHYQFCMPEERERASDIYGRNTTQQ
jgi:hypothetical protein